MGKVSVYHHAFNGGVVDKDKMPRVDLERMRLAAEMQTNWLATTTGKMFLRPGFEYLGSTYLNSTGILRDFVFGATDAALLELTDERLRVWVDDEVISRPAVTSSVTSGSFGSSTGWTLTAETGATCTISGGYLNLTASAIGSSALAKQTVTTSSAGVEHALRIIVDLGPVTFRCGSTDGGDEYVSETSLSTGEHSLAFTPTGSYYIQFESTAPVLRRVDSIEVESAGSMSLPTVWGSGELGLYRSAQSADVVFVALDGHPQKRIERRSRRSWSIVDYVVDAGPFTGGRTANVKLTPGATRGNTTLTASGSFFRPEHVGSLFRLFHSGQKVDVSLAGAGTFTPPIVVTGISDQGTLNYNDRDWSYVVAGTFTGNLTVQRSFDGEFDGFQDFPYAVTQTSPTVPGTGSYDNEDQDDNAIVWYRIGFKEGDYTDGEADVTITYDGGGGGGICRVTAYTSATSVDIEIIEDFKQTTATDDWQEGEWNDYRGYPSADALADGRLWWGGRDLVWGSVSDDFHNFDDETEGDSGPIMRAVATGGVNSVQWIMALQRLLFGTEGAVTAAKSSSLDEPLTPTNLAMKDGTTVGVAPVAAARIDARGLFVERSGRSIFELAFQADAADYGAGQLSKITTNLFSSGIKEMTVQRRPDTRVWVVCNDGSVVCIVYEPADEVLCFIPIETDGEIESMAVLPADEQDRVYALIKRTINSATVRFVEKMALDSEAAPGDQCKVMDACVAVSGSPTTTVTLSHLVGETVVAWADGAPVVDTDGDRVEFTVSGGGTITLPTAASDIVVGLPYTARYKSARLAYGADGGTAMLAKKHVDKVGLILTDFARGGVRYGSEFDNASHPLWPLPTEIDGQTADTVSSATVEDEETYPLNAPWSIDSRVCIETKSPFPAAVLGMVLEITTN